MIPIVAAAIVAPAASHQHSPAVSCGHPVTAKQSQPFIYLVWGKAHWRRAGSPGPLVLKAWHHRLKCSGPANRRAMLKTWQRQRLRFGRYRALRQVAPYPGGGTWWAVPYSIVWCESGTSGLWKARNPSGAEGPYQLLGHGQPWPITSWHDKMEHHRIAADLYRESGTAPWVSSRACWG